MNSPADTALLPAWPGAGTHRIPFGVYTSEQLHQRELQRYQEAQEQLAQEQAQQASLNQEAQAVAEAIERINTGELDKVVLARDVVATVDGPLDPRHLLLNLAVGGSWGAVRGIDDAAFPARMEVEWVRVYQR